jgi:hypothetical protein
MTVDPLSCYGFAQHSTVSLVLLMNYVALYSSAGKTCAHLLHSSTLWVLQHIRISHRKGFPCETEAFAPSMRVLLPFAQ